MKPRHVLGISGGKDSAALAIYLNKNYPQLNVEYYFCDTEKELPETYDYLQRLEQFLGKPIKYLPERKNSEHNEIHYFDYLLQINGSFLPSPRQRWCTIQMKLMPFEYFIAGDKAISYVAIRGDEDREAYVSRNENIQSIFPFRKNIWSEDVIHKVLHNSNIEQVVDIYKIVNGSKDNADFLAILSQKIDVPISEQFKNEFEKKLIALLDIDLILFNHIVNNFLKTTHYPLAFEDDFPLINDTAITDLHDVKKLLENTNLGMPPYYRKLPLEVDGLKGTYFRSRSGCYFCFFQQRIEWVWLYEQHPDLFKKAMAYEKVEDGYTWIENESLKELTRPNRIKQIKKEYLNKSAIFEKGKLKNSKYFVDMFEEEEEACTICTL